MRFKQHGQQFFTIGVPRSYPLVSLAPDPENPHDLSLRRIILTQSSGKSGDSIADATYFGMPWHFNFQDPDYSFYDIDSLPRLAFKSRPTVVYSGFRWRDDQAISGRPKYIHVPNNLLWSNGLNPSSKLPLVALSLEAAAALSDAGRLDYWLDGLGVDNSASVADYEKYGYKLISPDTYVPFHNGFLDYSPSLLFRDPQCIADLIGITNPVCVGASHGGGLYLNSFTVSDPVAAAQHHRFFAWVPAGTKIELSRYDPKGAFNVSFEDLTPTFFAATNLPTYIFRHNYIIIDPGQIYSHPDLFVKYWQYSRDSRKEPCFICSQQRFADFASANVAKANNLYTDGVKAYRLHINGDTAAKKGVFFKRSDLTKCASKDTVDERVNAGKAIYPWFTKDHISRSSDDLAAHDRYLQADAAETEGGWENANTYQIGPCLPIFQTIERFFKGDPEVHRFSPINNHTMVKAPSYEKLNNTDGAVMYLIGRIAAISPLYAKLLSDSNTADIAIMAILTA